MENYTPKEIVKELDKYIIGQKEAKKSVAIALRNRTRRKNVESKMQEEISPKNIIMIGSTGVGKTEVARRLAKLADAPFVKVEATKFTEVGYVGRDVESIIKDLINIAINNERKKMLLKVDKEAVQQANEAIINILFPEKNNSEQEDNNFSITLNVKDEEKKTEKNTTREKIKTKILNGEWDKKYIDVDIPPKMPSFARVLNFTPDSNSGFDQLEGFMKNIMGNFPMDKSMGGNKNKKKKMQIKDAREFLKNQISEKLIDNEKIIQSAIEKTENMGIVFLDEIDKIASNEGHKGANVSREGVQRDILPLVEGSQVNTKYGIIKTDHILFIAAGAFHVSSPSDLIPELQGRFPIRVELESLKVADLEQILSKPQNSIIKQYQALLETEGVALEFKKDAIKEIAKIANECNNKTNNIGARRLSTVIEKLLEDTLFNAPDVEKKIIIDKEEVKKKLDKIVEDKDTSKYIL